jgi:histone acetyltransferase (RNA polymerase elongator complex component)
VSLDTRSREIRNKGQGTRDKITSSKSQIPSPNIIIRKYKSSGGVEYFISFEDQLGYLYGFTRLLLPTDPVDVKGLGSDTAIIRELHVYGQVE